ncbi:F-box associated interaction domain [Arabidopsis thaliana x Arabidopsis arenosa]|uniref:F-box associated interaction domain n=1 Tax=Arabidopsis thaliana x Arabidopsis arenosa TaxID=1240361 RepID=A0A8T2AZD7_9BRAS|nr:F-box associated interaction domain [Arabidopsis thaliana x Arabidopsis arenosa]
MMMELPEDVLEEILCRVPATSLKRLRCICKQWNSLFTDKRFARKHFRKAPRQSLILMLKNLGFSSMSFNLHRVSPIEIIGELNLIDPHSSSYLFKIYQSYHSSDGLLLCVCVDNKMDDTRLVVWNPCTGQTKWIQQINRYMPSYTFATGSYQDNKSGNKSYKILSRRSYGEPEFEIYEIDSNSWRILDVNVDCNVMYIGNVTLKGKTYWFARDKKDLRVYWSAPLFLICFDYTTERFERLCLPYPYPYHGYRNKSLSVVREEKLSVLLQRTITSKTEIWVTNKIGETKVLSWIKVLTVDLKPELRDGIKFLVDEEKKFLVCIQNNGYKSQTMVYFFGEDKKVREVAFGDEFKPFLLNYVPSLTQIQQGDD